MYLCVTFADQIHLPAGHHPCGGQCADECQPGQGGRILHAHSQGESLFAATSGGGGGAGYSTK
jgi:hypothetical protein